MIGLPLRSTDTPTADRPLAHAATSSIVPEIGGADFRILEDFGGDAESDLAAEIEHQRFLASRRDQVDVVIDQQHLGAAEFRNADDHVAQVVGFALIQTGARLVHHDEPRLGDDAARDLDQPPFAGVEHRADALRLAARARHSPTPPR